MHVYLRRAGAAALLAAAGVVLPASCVRVDSELFIKGCISVPHDTCIAQVSETADLIVQGKIDGIYADQYTCAALVGNQLVARGDPNKLRTETSRVELYEADVQILNTSGEVIPTNSGPAEYSVPINGFVDPGNGSSPGYGVANITLLDGHTLQFLAAQAQSQNKVQLVQVSAILRGKTLGGQDVHTNEFLFPIEVCGGCQCEMPVGDTCVAPAQMPTAVNCFGGQDLPVDCRVLDPCKFLECPLDNTGHSQLVQAHCPSTSGLGDGSCCNP